MKAEAPPKRRVEFCTSLRIVLIPSRTEYKKAGLYSELWWASIDFMQFQASANSEIRMLASYEGIGAKAARFKLYQPGSHGIDPDEFLAFVGVSVNTGDSGFGGSISPAITPVSSMKDLAQRGAPTPPKSAASRESAPSSTSPVLSSIPAPTECSVLPPFSPQDKQSLPPLSSAASEAASASPRSSSELIPCSSSSSSSSSSSRGSSSGGGGGGGGRHSSTTSSSGGESETVDAPPHSKVQIQAQGKIEARDDQDDMFGHFDFKEEEIEQASVGAGEASTGLTLTTEGAALESERDSTGSLSSNPRNRTSSLGSGSSTEDEEKKDDGDDSIAPKFARVSSLDCVSSALRVPLPEDDSTDSDWTWDGKLKSESSLHQRGSFKKVGSPSSSARLESHSSVDNFWTLVVAMEKPNGLDGIRKSRFQNRHFSSGGDDSMSLITVSLWLGAFVAVVYVAWSWTADPPS